QALQQPKAVDRNLSHRGPCGGKPQTPRAGRWREGGLAVLPYRTAVSAEIAVLLRLRERPGPVGPLDPPRPAPPRNFPGAHRPKSLGCKAHRENEEPCLKTDPTASCPGLTRASMRQ